MPCGDHANARLVPNRGDDPIYLYAGDAEYDLDALSDKRLGEGFPSAHLDHDQPPP